MSEQGEGTITSAVRALRLVISESNEKLRSLAVERERRRRRLALDEAYPSRLKTKSRKDD